jgi:hypothetical protein
LEGQTEGRLARGLRIGLGVVVLIIAVGWPFIWGHLQQTMFSGGRAAVELLMLWLVWWLFFASSKPRAK